MDGTVKTCLERIRRGDVAAVGVLADYLEENGLPYAKRVRSAWMWYCEYVESHTRPDVDYSRRKLARWEVVAWARRELRRRIKNQYGRKWKPLPLKAFTSSGI